MQSPTDANDSPIEEMAADGISSGVEAEGELTITHPFNPDRVQVTERRVAIQNPFDAPQARQGENS